MKKLSILGIRGIPASHGGFETFAEYLALYLQKKNWQVTVYCQEDKGEWHETEWQGVRLVHVPVVTRGALGTIIFDLKTVIHSLKDNNLLLTLGYNTAIFNFLHFILRRKNIINMDGIEWHRDKWGLIAKAWFWFNERLGCWFGSHLVADHPRIEDHLATRVCRDKITMIPYGALEIQSADASVLTEYGLEKNGYFIAIARAEPENSLLEIVSAFSKTHRNKKLVILGSYKPEENLYHKQVMSAASDEVLFLGAIYDGEIVAALRFHSIAYLHGHRVGGTNPSLVEALGAGNAIIAHNNHFNRWVADDAAIYFSDINDCDTCITSFILDTEKLKQKKINSKKQFLDRFTWDEILSQYESLLNQWIKRM